jgi:hypothetical protein
VYSGWADCRGDQRRSIEIVGIGTKREEMRVNRNTAIILILVGSLPVFGTIHRKAAVADDPYAPLALYDGKWDSTTTIGEKESVRIENHCARTGLFFVCEQMLNGKTGSLVVFLPVTRNALTTKRHGKR